MMAILLGVPLLGPTALWGAAGDLDPTFGNGGGVITEVEEDHSSIIYDLARQADGKLVAAGYAEISGLGAVVAVARYDDTGSLDPAFGVDGIVLTPLGGYYPLVHDVLIQSDGRIVVVARINPSTGGDIGLLRYDTSGTLDPSFGSGGVVITSLGGPVENAVAGALQPDDKIVVLVDASISFNGPPPDDVLVLRYEADGGLDASFGVGGVATVDFGGPDEAAALLLQPDGRIVVAGFSRNDPEDLSLGSAIAVARLETDGSLDSGFGSGGIFVRPAVKQDQPHAMLRMPDGKLFIAGFSYTWDGPFSKTGAPFFLRLTDTGAVDATFGPGGVVLPSVAPLIDTLALTPAGDIVAMGFSVGSVFTIGMGVARYHANGSLDPTFGNGGHVVVLLDQTGSNATAGLVEPDGRIVVGGWASEASQFNNPPYFIDYYFAVARLQGDGGTCGSDADCGVCESCAPGGTCVFGPRTTCTGAEIGGARVALDNPGVDRAAIDASFERHRVKFRWRGATPLGFDPTSTDDVGLCVYTPYGRVLRSVAPAGGICGSRPCWTGTPGARLAYHDADRTPNGIEKIRLSRARARVDGSGFNLSQNVHGFPSPSALLGTPPVVVQLHGGNGACLQASFTDLEPTWKPIGQGSFIQVGVRGTGQ